MISSKGKSKMSERFQRQSRKNFEFCSHKNCTLTLSSSESGTVTVRTLTPFRRLTLTMTPREDSCGRFAMGVEEGGSICHLGRLRSRHIRHKANPFI